MNLKENCPTLTFPFNRFKQFQGLGGPLYKNQNNIDPPPPLLIYTQLMWPIFKNKYQHFIVLLILTNKGSNSKYLNTRKCIFTWMKEEKSLFDVCIWKWVCMQFCLFPNSNCGIFKQRPFKNYIHRPYATLSFWQLIKSYTCIYNYAVNIPLDSAFHSQSYI